MNNIQLSILLSSYAEHLALIRDSISKELKSIDGVECENVETRRKWIGEGKKPLFDIFPKKDDYEWETGKGDPVCLVELSLFIANIEDKAIDLMEYEGEGAK